MEVVTPSEFDFQPNESYLLFLEEDESGLFGRVMVGPSAVFKVNPDESLTAVNQHPHSLKRIVKEHFKGSLKELRAAANSPVVIDVAGDGFELTAKPGGVRFDLNNDGRAGWVSRTERGSDDAWLALDRNGNGTIDSGYELFGDQTPQPATGEPNGFAALAVYDLTESGGNGDGVGDADDAVYAGLRLWQDLNHNGLSEHDELQPLPAHDVVRIHLDYKESKRTDGHGNSFRYRAKVDDARGAKVDRWAWDVFLVSAP